MRMRNKTAHAQYTVMAKGGGCKKVMRALMDQQIVALLLTPVAVTVSTIHYLHLSIALGLGMF